MRATPDFKLRLEFVGENHENVSGRSSKYWECIVLGGRFIRRWGKIGTNGQTMVEDFGSVHAAKNAAMKMAESKRAKGYELEVDVVTLLGAIVNEGE